MPTSLPTPVLLPGPNRRVLVWGAVLALILAVPIIAMLALEGILAARCTTREVSHGVVQGKVLWRIEQRDCAGAKLPFYDVLIGADGKTLASAVTGRGDPRPLDVVSAGENHAEIRLSGPVRAEAGQARSVFVKLRRSGSPSERIDLEKLSVDAAGGGAK